MSFLGIGPGELLLIIILLLVVVGPERLPGLARSLGRGLVQVRNWVQTSPDAALVLRARQELESELAEIRTSLLEVQSVRDEVLGVAKQLDEAVSPIASARTSLSDLIKAPADKPQPRIGNGQAADPASGVDLPGTPADGDPPIVAPAESETADVLVADNMPNMPVAPTTAESDVTQVVDEVADTATAPARSSAAVEELGLHIQALAADLRAFQDQARAEAAVRSAQIESVMADMHELQKQLKERGLLAVDWQPPSWNMHMPGQQLDTQIEEADT
jgi:sec-independent protein translocase protein TatB